MMVNHCAATFKKFRFRSVNHTPPPTAIGVTGCSSIVGARKLQDKIPPAQQNTVPGEGSRSGIGNAIRQTGDINSSPGDFDAESIPVTHPIGPQRLGGNQQPTDQKHRQAKALRDRIQQCC